MRVLILLLCSLPTWAACSASISSPSDGAFLSSTIQSLNVVLTTCPNAYMVRYILDGRVMEPYGTVTSYSSLGPWSTTLYPTMFGDSYGKSLSAKVYDITGALLATTATVTVHFRTMGTDAFYIGPTSPLSGSVEFNIAETHPRPAGGGTGQILSIDGRVNGIQDGWMTDFGGYAGTGVNGIRSTINTARFRNGTHIVDFEQWNGTAYVPDSAQPFVGSACNTTNETITLPYHALINGRAITFTTDGVLCAPLAISTTYYVVGATYAQSASDLIQVAATPGGSPINLTSQGSGNHTVVYTIPNPWWCGITSLSACVTGPEVSVSAPYSHRWGVYTFANGATAMEMRAPWTDCFLSVANPTCNVAPVVINTDGSTTAVTATIPTYTVVVQGGVVGCVTVNSSGTVTKAAILPIDPCYADITLHCVSGACNGLADVSVRVMVQDTNIFKTFARDGQVRNSYVTGQSIMPRTGWNLSAGQMYNNARIGIEAVRSGINATVDGLAGNIGSTQVTSCAAVMSGFNDYFPIMQSAATAYNMAFYLLMWGYLNQPWYIDAINNNTLFDRKACINTVQTAIVADGRAVAQELQDEVNGLMGNYPAATGIIGNAYNSYFSSLAVVSNVATLTVNMDFLNAWSQATGTGDWIQLSGSSTSALNGYYKVASPVYGSQGQTTQFTITTAGVADSTHNSGNDAALKLTLVRPSSQQWFGANNWSVWPGKEASQLIIQPWDANLTSIVASSGIATVNYTGCCGAGGLTTGRLVRIWSATNTNLHNVQPLTVVNANAFTIPTLAANGTYNVSTDANLYMTVVPNYGNNYITDIITAMRATPGYPAILAPVLGQSLVPQAPDGIKNWLGDSNLVNAAPDYGSLNAAGVNMYAAFQSHYQRASEGYNPVIGTRAYQLEPRLSLFGFDQNFVQMQREWKIDLNNDRPTLLVMRGPGPFIMWQVANGITGWRAYNWMSNPGDQYATTIPSFQDMGIREYTLPHVWNSMALAFNLLGKVEKYILQPRLNSPSYGPMFFTAAHQVDGINGCSINCGRVLIVGSLSELPITETIDLSAYQYLGGTISRYSLTDRNLTLATLATDTTAESYTFNSVDPGETLIYIFQPSGQASDIETLTTQAPSQFPSGTSKMAVRLSYYKQTIVNAPAIDCTTGCAIPTSRPVWYQTIWQGSDGSIKSVSDPQEIK